MNASISFLLPEEEDELNTAINGYNYKAALIEFNSLLRGKLKYEDLNDDVYAACSQIRQSFLEILEERNIKLYE